VKLLNGVLRMMARLPSLACVQMILMMSSVASIHHALLAGEDASEPRNSASANSQQIRALALRVMSAAQTTVVSTNALLYNDVWKCLSTIPALSRVTLCRDFS